MRKHWIALCLVLCLALGLTACGGTGGTAAAVRMARRAGEEVRLIETGRAALGAEAAFTGGDAVFQMQPAQPQYKNLRR